MEQAKHSQVHQQRTNHGKIEESPIDVNNIGVELDDDELEHMERIISQNLEYEMAQKQQARRAAPG